MTQPDFESASIDPKDGDIVHSGGKVGEAGEDLQDDSSTKKDKSDAGKDLNKHKDDYHP